jgi:putative salt-induced outer membrane protein YdiY
MEDQRPLTPSSRTVLFSLFLVLAVWGLRPVRAVADEVRVQNGDRLTGDVVRQEKRHLRLRTTYAGTVEIAWKDVREVRFDGPGEVLMKDETVLRVVAVSREGDRLTLQPEGTAAAVTVDASEVKVIEPEAWELGRGRKFEGRVNVALENEKGNSESNEFDFDFTVKRSWRWHRVEGYGEIEYDTTRGLDSSDNWTWYGNYNRLFRSQWYASAFALLKHDRFADLRLRFLVGPAAGYRFFDREPLSLSVEAGVMYLDDDFIDQGDQQFWGPAWWVTYKQKVWKERLEIFHRQLGFVAANDSSKQLWRSWTGVRVPLVAGFVSSVEYEIDYDSQPAVEALTTDRTLNLKLGYKW